ncbi:hypothetical protein [Glycomyces arizonensis]|uniref:hypothetical protein n=1 Tax=Glycomyces arizonensis TaxID=256035 RepID=UPI0004083D65|nr:hypothetical protein [Glycomyces arizonensis]
MRTIAPLAAALCACALAVGLAACDGDPGDPASESPTAAVTASESPSAEATASETTETTEAPEPTEAPSDDDGTDPRMEPFIGAWTEDVPMMGSSFTVTGDGFVVLTGEGGSFEGTIVLGDGHRHQLELVSTAGGSPPAAMHWELEYHPPADAIRVYDTRDDGTVYEREFVREA